MEDIKGYRRLYNNDPLRRRDVKGTADRKEDEGRPYERRGRRLVHKQRQRECEKGFGDFSGWGFDVKGRSRRRLYEEDKG